jgi:hypothetical protein
MKDYQLPDGKALVLRSCRPDLTSYNNFKWPESGTVTCPDWRKSKDCGNGLHGWLWAQGNFGLKYKEPNAKWLVVEVDEKSVIDISGKVKYPTGEVLFCGAFKPAYDFVMKWYWIRHAEELKTYTVVTNSKSNHAASDDEAAFTSKTKTHASAAGNYGHASAAGNYGHASAAGNYGHASAAGESGHASAAGNSGHASAAGYSGHASAAGNSGHAVVLGNNGKARCGKNGALILSYHDGVRKRHVIGYDGENGIEAGKWYKVNSKNELEECTGPK